MSNTFTKKDIEDLLSKQTKVILGAVDFKFQNMEASFSFRLQNIEYRMDEFDRKPDNPG